jgi:penicillin-binding protein 2
LEAGWGGTIEQRMAARYNAYIGQPAPVPPTDPTSTTSTP